MRPRLRRAILGIATRAIATGIVWAAFSPVQAHAAAGRIPIVRIGIEPAVASARIGCDGPWKIGVMGGGGAIEDLPAGANWIFTAAGDLLRARDHRGLDRGGGRDTLFVFPGSKDGPPLSVDGKPYRGELLVYASGGDETTVVNILDIESYLRGVLPGEIGRGLDGGYEALKAQAVAARSYTLAQMNRWRARGFDLLATVDDQVYGGIESERPETDQAVSETCGVVALSDGAPIQAYYSSTCGGMTTTPEEVWGKSALPYLTAHRDAAGPGQEAFCAASPQHRWRETWTGPEIEKILRATLADVTGEKGADRWGPLKDLRLKRRSASYRVEDLEITFAKKRFDLGGDKIRWILRRPTGEPLRSAVVLKIEVARWKGRVTGVGIDGAGYGHGVGLCQMGALGMARAGYDYQRILRFYYRGTQLVRAYERCPA